jgi:tetratricopeptide (TPR) repeat protein
MLYEFGPFRLDGAERRLQCERRIVALTPKALDILLVLVANAGRAVGKDELMEKVWPDTSVEEATLAQNWNKRTRASIDEAIRHFEKAIAADPTTALAYSALGDCHLILGSLLWIPPKAAAAKANAALAHALRLDESLAEPHAALGFVRSQMSIAGRKPSVVRARARAERELRDRPPLVLVSARGAGPS